MLYELFSLWIAKNVKERRTSPAPPCKGNMKKRRSDRAPWSATVVMTPLPSVFLRSKLCSD